MQTSRRAFMGLAASTGVAAALAACASVNPNNTPQQNMAQVVTDVSMIAGAFAKALPQMTALPALTPAVKATITTDVAELQAVAKALATAATSTAAQPLVQTVETDVNAVVDALATIPLPVGLSAVVQAATVLLPIVEIAVGMSVPAATANKAKAVAMSPDEARAILRLNS